MTEQPPVRVGEVFDLGAAVVDRDSMVAFAVLYDPQPFHLDEEAARASVFGTLVASGLQTLAIMQGLAVRSGLLVRLGAEAGLGTDETRLLNPVRPGDDLRVTAEVLGVTPSRHREGQGIGRCLFTATNQHGKTVARYEGRMLVRLDRWAAG